MSEIENSKNEIKEIEEILENKTPFQTLFYNSLGPFIAEIVGAAYGIVDTFWISRLVNQEGNAAMSLVSLMDTFGRAFGYWVGSSASSQLSRIRGEKKLDEIPQIFADLFRLCFIFGIIAPLILIPCIPLLLNFFNATGNIRQYGYDYLQPLLYGTIITCLNFFFCGCLQSEGKSTTYGIVQVSSFLLNMFIFDPLLMGPFKLGMKGAALSTIISEAIPMLIIGYYFFNRKYLTFCNFSNLISKKSIYTWDAIKIGFTQFISQIFFNLPSFFSRKYIEVGATKMGKYSLILAGLNPVMRLWSFPGSYSIALSIAFLPISSYSIGAKNFQRTKDLFKMGVLMTIIWCGIAEIILIGLGKYVSMIFDPNPEFVSITWKMLRITYSLSFLMGVEMIGGSFLQSLKKNKLSLLLSFLTRFLPVPLFGSILFFTDPNKNVFRTLLMYPLNDLFSSIITLLLVYKPYSQLLLNNNEEKVTQI